jgi:hypothetical protein
VSAERDDGDELIAGCDHEVCRVGKGGHDVSINLRRRIRPAHLWRRGGHGGPRAVLRRHTSANLPTLPDFMLEISDSLVLISETGGTRQRPSSADRHDL